MMPVIRISDATHQKLQRLAVPLIDNPDTLIARLADAALAGSVYSIPNVHAEQAGQSPTALPNMDIPPHPPLAFTRLRTASFGGVEIEKTSWGNLAKYAHEVAYQKLGSIKELKMVSRANLREGKHEQDGFTYLPTIDISIQATEANLAWENSLRLARRIGVSIEVSFEWLHKPKAARPGETDTLEWHPHQ